MFPTSESAISSFTGVKKPHHAVGSLDIDDLKFGDENSSGDRERNVYFPLLPGSFPQIRMPAEYPVFTFDSNKELINVA